MTHFLACLRRMTLLAALFTLPCSGWAQNMTVSTAASLSDALKALGARYEALHPGTTISHNFAASGVLLQQISRGAPVDIFISADQATMDRAQEQGLIAPDSRRNFVENQLVLIQPATAQGTAVNRLADLSSPKIRRVAVGKPDSVPAGRYTRQALGKNGLWEALEPRFIYAESVRQVLDYVARGEVDAGFVYLSDAQRMPDKVKVVEAVETAEVVSYPLAIVSTTDHTAAAQHFIDFLQSDDAMATLKRYGFRQPAKAGLQ